MLSRAHPFLGRALAISFALHAALIAAPAPRGEPPAHSALKVWLRGAVAAPQLQAPALQPSTAPKLLLPEPTAQNANAARRAAAPGEQQRASLRPLAGEAAQRAGEQLAREMLYPPEAIERGLQGEALVLLFLDEAGDAVAARLESSSGHALLDDAAVRAARTLRSLPSSAPREALLQVRFRLR